MSSSDSSSFVSSGYFGYIDHTITHAPRNSLPDTDFNINTPEINNKHITTKIYDRSINKCCLHETCNCFALDRHRIVGKRKVLPHLRFYKQDLLIIYLRDFNDLQSSVITEEVSRALKQKDIDTIVLENKPEIDRCILDKLCSQMSKHAIKVRVDTHCNDKTEPEVNQVIDKHIPVDLTETLNGSNIAVSNDTTPRKNDDYRHEKEGLPDDLLAPPSLNFNIPTDGVQTDRQTCLNFSNPRLREFLNIVFDIMPDIYPASPTSGAKLLNPNYIMRLKLREGCENSLPKHKPINSNLIYRKATKIILDQWEQLDLIRPTNYKSHCSRIIVVKKKINKSTFLNIREHLLNNHNINIDENDVERVYTIDPDLIVRWIPSLYRLCLDARVINEICESAAPLQQNTLHTLYDVLDILSDDKPENDKLLRINSYEQLEQPKSKFENQEIPWHPEPLDKNISDTVKSFINDKNNFLINGKEDTDIRLYVTSLDIKNAHCLVDLCPETQRLLTAVTPIFSYIKFIRASFGLNQVSTYFNAAICDILQDLIISKNIIIYADDVLILSKGTLNEHCMLIYEVFKRLVQNGVKISVQKSFFAVNKFSYLGFEFSETGFSLSDERIRAITEYPRPLSQKSCQRFVGLLNYLSIFIPNLSSHLSPFTDSCAAKTEFIWTPEHEKSFEIIKSLIAKQVQLSFPQKEEIMYLFVDSSNRGGGGFVLCGKDESNLRPVCFLSKKYNKHERRLYSSLELEISCLLYCLQKLSYLFSTRELRVWTDAKSILFILKSKKVGSSPRLQRLCTKLSQLPIKYEIRYTPPHIGALQVADALSRCYEDDLNKVKVPANELRKISKEQINHELTEKHVYTFQDIEKYLHSYPDCVKVPGFPDNLSHSDVSFESRGKNLDYVCNIYEPLMQSESFYTFEASNLIDKDRLIKSQRQDPELGQIIRKLEAPELYDLDTNLEMYTIRDGLLWKNVEKGGYQTSARVNKGGYQTSARVDKGGYQTSNLRICLPASEIKNAVISFHLVFLHLGIRNIYQILKNHFTARNLYKYTYDIISSCIICQLSNISTERKNKIEISSKSLSPMSDLLIDHMKMEKSRGYSSILMCVDLYSSYIFIIPVKDEKSVHVAKGLDFIFSNFGPPSNIKSDNSKSLLKSAQVQKVLKKWNVKNSHLTLPYAPYHNARCERRIKSARDTFRKLKTSDPQAKWTDVSSYVQFFHNNTPMLHHTDEGNFMLSPFEKMFGRTGNFDNMPRSIQTKDFANILRLVNLSILHTRTKYRDQFNDKAKIKQIKPGNFVLLQNLSTPGALELPRKYKPYYYKSIFLVKGVEGQTVYLEDIASAVIFKAHIDHIKLFKNAGDDYDFLPETLKKQIGNNVWDDITQLDRSDLLKNLKNMGFNVDNDMDWLDSAAKPIIPKKSPIEVKPQIDNARKIDRNSSDTGSHDIDKSADDESSMTSCSSHKQPSEIDKTSVTPAVSNSKKQLDKAKTMFRTLRNRLKIKAPDRLKL